MNDAHGRRGEAAPAGSPDRIATVPNLISLIRILLIPVFVALLIHPGTEVAGLVLLACTVATDWVDGYVARRTGQVSDLGKLLDPVADRLALAAALIALVIRHALPLWAALLVLVRDVVVLAAGLVLLVTVGIRIDVRWIGKAATLGLMVGIPSIAWASFGLPLAGAARVIGWGSLAIGIVLYYVAAVIYAGDIARALRIRGRPST